MFSYIRLVRRCENQHHYFFHYHSFIFIYIFYIYILYIYGKKGESWGKWDYKNSPTTYPRGLNIATLIRIGRLIGSWTFHSEKVMFTYCPRWSRLLIGHEAHDIQSFTSCSSLSTVYFLSWQLCTFDIPHFSFSIACVFGNLEAYQKCNIICLLAGHTNYQHTF